MGSFPRTELGSGRKGLPEGGGMVGKCTCPGLKSLPDTNSDAPHIGSLEVFMCSPAGTWDVAVLILFIAAEL